MNSFHKFIQLSVAIVCGLLTPAYNADSTTSFTDYDEGYHISPCHVWRTGDPDVNNFDLIRNYKLEEYREELVHRIIGSDAYQTAYHIEKSTNLTIESTQAFPLGVPHEFSFECTFRTERPPTRPWYLFYLSDYEYSSQLSVTINPLHGSIDFALPLFDGTLFTASFLDSKIFNGLWHKVMLGLTQDSVRLWVDCKPAHDKYGRERVPLDHRAQIDAADGYFTLAQDVGSGSTVPIDLQWMVLSCDSDKPNRTSCEELPQYDLKFKDPDVVEPESEEERPILMASAGRTTTCPETCPRGPPGRDGSPGPPGPPGSETPTSLLRGDKGQKGEVGMVGIEGIPGQKGEPGEVATSGFVKEILQQFYEESKGHKGEKGEPGNLDKLFLDNHIEELKGEKGEPGPIGMAGVPGLPGYRGQKGEPGSKFENIQPNISHYRGQKGERGYPGPPGPPGLVNKELIVSGEKGEPGENGHPGMVGLPGTRGLPGPQGPAGICMCEPNANPGPPGESGEKGSDGPQGLPGYEGTPGFPGPPGPPGPPGSPGLPGARESFRYEESEIRDICMGVIREYITEIQSTLIGTPGATRRIPGKTGRPGPKGPPGEPGPQGPRGDMGFVGLPGLRGLKGDMGIPGLDGAKGNQGNDGIGRDGQPGPQGPPGVDGQPGRDGISGRPGDRGDPGMPGIPGMRGPPGEPGTCTSCPYLSYPQFYQQQQTKGPSNDKG